MQPRFDKNTLQRWKANERNTLKMFRKHNIHFQPPKFRYTREIIYTLRHFLKNCNKEERQEFKMILQDIKELVPKRLSQEKELTRLNLLSGIMNLWERGYYKGVTYTEERYDKKQKLYQKDIRDNKLFPIARNIYNIKNNDARATKLFLILREGAALLYAKKYFKEHRKKLKQQYNKKYPKIKMDRKQWREYWINEIVWRILYGRIKIPRFNELRLPKDSSLYRRNNQLYVRKNTSEEKKISLEIEIRNIKRITLSEAMEEANKSYKIFPEKEFERDKKKIGDRFKQYLKKLKTERK
jgi:hypothetical protein